MAKYTYDFKHKREWEIERERERERERAKPGQAVYFTFNRGVFRTLSNEVISLEVTIFTKISILDVWKGSEYVVA